MAVLHLLPLNILVKRALFVPCALAILILMGWWLFLTYMKVSIQEQDVWSPPVAGTYSDWKLNEAGHWVRHATIGFRWYIADFEQTRPDEWSTAAPRLSTLRLQMNRSTAAPAITVSLLFWFISSASWLVIVWKRSCPQQTATNLKA